MGSSDKTDKDDEIDAIKIKTDNLPIDPTSETNATTNKNSIITEVDNNEAKIDIIDAIVDDIQSKVNDGVYGLSALKDIFDEIKGAGWSNETLKAIYDAILTAGIKDWTNSELEQIRDALGVDGTKTTATGGQLQDVATEANATANTNTIVSEVNINETKIDSIISTLSSLVANIWSYTTRTLTSFGSLVNDIADQVWDELLSEHLNVGSTGKALDDADATADPSAVAQAVWAELTAGSGSSTFGELVKRIAGLCQENYRIFNQTYTTIGGLSYLTSATIKIYPSAVDTNADTNSIASYSVVSSYDAQGRLTNYKVTKN